MPRRRTIGKYEKLHKILEITSPTTYDKVIDLAIENIPEVDWSVQKIVERLRQEGIEVRRGGGFNGTCVSGL